jgi:hypothetical protein
MNHYPCGVVVDGGVSLWKHWLLIVDASVGQVPNTGSELPWFLVGSQAKNQMGATFKKMEVKILRSLRTGG